MIQFGFYALSLVAVAMIVFVLRYGDDSRKLTTQFLVAGLVWLAYLIVISGTGVLQDFSLPPKVPLLVVVPAIVGILIFTGTRRFGRVLNHLPLHVPVLLTTFRILVELLIYGGHKEGVFPERVTFEGLNYDILVGIVSLPVGILIMSGKLSTRAVWAWNVLSLMVLGLTVYSFVTAYYFSDFIATTGNRDFVRFPYLLLAGVLLPTAIMLHVVSIRQMIRRSR